MKRFSIATMLIVIIALLTAGIASAGDKVINQALTADPYIGIGKDGNEFVRLMITEKRTLNGMEYDAQVPVMAFTSNGTAQQAKSMKKGDTLKAIVQIRQYQGDASYTVRQFVN